MFRSMGSKFRSLGLNLQAHPGLATGSDTYIFIYMYCCLHSNGNALASLLENPRMSGLQGFPGTMDKINRATSIKYVRHSANAKHQELCSVIVIMVSF